MRPVGCPDHWGRGREIWVLGRVERWAVHAIRAPWLVLLCALAALSVSVLRGPASASALALQEVGRFDAPTFVTSDPGDPNRLFIVERDGRIRLTEGGSTTTFLDIESIVQSPDDPVRGGE